jgi:hypothetical protein
MSDPVERASEPTQFPGLSPEDFEAALGTFVKLRDSNKISLFLARNSAVRVIGDRAQFAIALANSLNADELQTEKANDFLSEVTTIVSIFLPSRKVEDAVTNLERFQFDSFLNRISEDTDAKAEFRSLLRRKVEAVATRLISGAFLERAKRLLTAAGATFEELDCEIVSHRHTATNDEQVVSPFLRLRLRYSRGTDFTFPFSLPWLSATNETKSFEFECDETDVDLLVSRLLEAKRLLSDSLSAKVREGEPTDVTR